MTQPDARSDALDRHPDRLLLMGMSFFGRHGALPAERELGQTFAVDVTLEGDFSTARRSDRLEDALDYRRAWTQVREVVEGPPVRLLEALADRIAHSLVRLPGVRRAVVRVGKRPPLPGEFAMFAVEVTLDAAHSTSPEAGG